MLTGATIVCALLAGLAFSVHAKETITVSGSTSVMLLNCLLKHIQI